MSNLQVKIGQVWRARHTTDEAFEKTVRWVSDDSRVWYTYKDEDYLYDDAAQTFAKNNELKVDSGQLNDNQQVVLEWLKSNDSACKVPMLPIFEMATLNNNKVRGAYRKLSVMQEFEVLAAFAQWGLESEAENE